jgi:hypothetical protein
MRLTTQHTKTPHALMVWAGVLATVLASGCYGPTFKTSQGINVVVDEGAVVDEEDFSKAVDVVQKLGRELLPDLQRQLEDYYKFLTIEVRATPTFDCGGIRVFGCTLAGGDIVLGSGADYSLPTLAHEWVHRLLFERDWADGDADPDHSQSTLWFGRESFAFRGAQGIYLAVQGLEENTGEEE